ncbi:MAG: hypothetical protein ACK4NR_02045 [Micavibrio sp.]
MRDSKPGQCLNEQQLATLHARFIVPIAVQMILNDSEQLDDACEAALHQSLSDLDPDTGLLCLALCAQHIAAAARPTPITKMLALSSARIADEYGIALLAEHTHSQKRLSDHEALTLLQQVPEDLEELATLMDAVLAQSGPHSPEGLLCDILSIQAMVHAERAEHELAELTFLKQQKRVKPAAPKLEYLAENVIVFPR